MRSHQDLHMGRASSKREPTSHGAAPDQQETGAGEFLFCPANTQFQGAMTQQLRRYQQEYALKTHNSDQLNSTNWDGFPSFPVLLFPVSDSCFLGSVPKINYLYPSSGLKICSLGRGTYPTNMQPTWTAATSITPRSARPGREGFPSIHVI